MSRPGNVPGLRIGSVRQMAVAGVNMDEAKTNLRATAGCRSPARTFLMPRLVEICCTPPGTRDRFGYLGAPPLSAGAPAPYARVLLANCSIVNMDIIPDDQPIHQFPG